MINGAAAAAVVWNVVKTERGAENKRAANACAILEISLIGR